MLAAEELKASIEQHLARKNYSVEANVLDSPPPGYDAWSRVSFKKRGAEVGWALLLFRSDDTIVFDHLRMTEAEQKKGMYKHLAKTFPEFAREHGYTHLETTTPEDHFGYQIHLKAGWYVTDNENVLRATTHEGCPLEKYAAGK